MLRSERPNMNGSPAHPTLAGAERGPRFAGAWAFLWLLLLAGALMCVLRATRRVGVLFCIAALAGLVAFHAVVGLARATGQTRWHEWKDSQKIPPSPSR
jgi:hypothetical protein